MSAIAEYIAFHVRRAVFWMEDADDWIEMDEQWRRIGVKRRNRDLFWKTWGIVKHDRALQNLPYLED